MEARRESPRVVLKRSVLPAPAPVLSFVLTVFLASLVGTFTAKGFHQTLVDLEFFGELNTNHPLTTAPHGRELEVRGQSGDAQESVSNQISANGEQPGGATNATGNATSSSTSSASANTSKTIAVEISPVSLWPLPLSVSRGNWSLALSSHFRILPKRGLPALVSKAAVRLTSSLLRKHQAGFKRWFSGRDLPMLQVLHIRIHQPDGSRSYVQALGTNESYSLRINYSPGSQPTAKLDAASAVGALRGLETFRQLCRRLRKQGPVLLEQAPWIIVDQPRFPHRALALDTSEHLLPISRFHQAFQVMEQAKLNVLHWKLSSSSSSSSSSSGRSSSSKSSGSNRGTRPFPIDLPSLQSSTAQGRASTGSRARPYTAAEVARLVRYAEERGITVVPEIDLPGGVEAWGLAHPELWPSEACRSPIDVSSKKASKVLGTVLKELRALFPGPVIHLGGSKSNWTCWNKGKRGKSVKREEGKKRKEGEEAGSVAKWLAGQDMSVMDGYAQFVVKGLELASAAGWQWMVLNEDAFLQFGERLSEKVTVENTFERGVKDAVVSIGLEALVAYPPQSPGTPGALPDWWEAHSWEPCADLNAIRFWPQVLGGVLNMHAFLDFPAQQRPSLSHSHSGNATAGSGEAQGQGLMTLAALAEKLWSSSESVDDQGREEVGLRLERFIEDLDYTVDS